MQSPPNTPSRIKKLFRRTLFTMVSLITLGALFFAEEDLRGSRAWADYKREMETKGGFVDAARLIPAAVPDEQNLTMIAFFTNAEAIHLPEAKFNRPKSWVWHYRTAADLTNWAEAFGSTTTDPAQAASTVLAALDKQEPLIAELKNAGQRTSCRFNIDYENWLNNTNVPDSALKLFAQVKGFFRVLSLRAQAELVSSQSNQAVDDIELMFRVNTAVQEEPLLISQLVGYATIELLMQPLAEGLAEHRWSDSQLQILQEHLQQIDLLASTQRAFDGERAFCVNPFFNQMTFKPRGWDRLEQLNFNRAIDDTIRLRIDLVTRRIDPSVSHSCDVAVTNLMHNAFFHHRTMAAMTLVGYEHTFMKTAATQNDVDEMIVGCALERYRLAEGQYPDKLDDLSPKFATTLPHDVITGQPLKYHLAENGRFILYSIGWNDIDDGGKIAMNKAGTLDSTRGDWVFEYPN